MEIGHRPWGFYTVLADENDHKVKRIVVRPGGRLSLQCHRFRDEHWYIVKGRGVVTVDDSEWEVKAGKAVDILRGQAHRISNDGTEDLCYIEVQTGTYFDEDDIERLADDYGRV